MADQNLRQPSNPLAPPTGRADQLAAGMAWCECGLHQFPKLIGQTILRSAIACPVCRPDDYSDRIAKPVHVVTWLTDDSQRIPREAAS